MEALLASTDAAGSGRSRRASSPRTRRPSRSTSAQASVWSAGASGSRSSTASGATRSSSSAARRTSGDTARGSGLAYPGLGCSPTEDTERARRPAPADADDHLDRLPVAALRVRPTPRRAFSPPPSRAEHARHVASPSAANTTRRSRGSHDHERAGETLLAARGRAWHPQRLPRPCAPPGIADRRYLTVRRRIQVVARTVL